MQKPKVEKVKLPYASNVANFYGDQGAMSGNSFLGKLFQGTGRTRVTRAFSSGKKGGKTGSGGNVTGGWITGGPSNGPGKKIVAWPTGGKK